MNKNQELYRDNGLYQISWCAKVDSQFGQGGVCPRVEVDEVDKIIPRSKKLFHWEIGRELQLLLLFMSLATIVKSITTIVL